MTPEEFEHYKKQDYRQHKDRTTVEEDGWLEEAYERLSPQQKGAMHRLWRQRNDDEEYNELASGCI